MQHLKMGACGLSRDRIKMAWIDGKIKEFFSKMNFTYRKMTNFVFRFTYSMMRNPDPNGAEQLIFDKPQPEYPIDLFTACPVKKGSLVLIHGLVIHRSDNNLSDKSRYAYTFHVMESHNVKYSPDNWLQLPEGEQFAELY